MTTDLHYASIDTLQDLYRHRKLSVLEVVQHFIERMKTYNEQLHAVITIVEDDSIARAVEADSALRTGAVDDKPLLGIPITVKDSVPTKGIRTTQNSRTKGDWIPETEPLPIKHLREAGAIIIAKANCNEYFGIPSADDRFLPPRTPFNPNYVAIGSSSGSGVAMAAGLGVASIGTDSAGSVRLPAAQAGVFGLKATNGFYEEGVSARHSTFSVIGPLTRTTRDAALITSIMANQQPLQVSDEGVSELKIGVPWKYINSSPVEDEVKAAFEQLLTVLDDAGAILIDIDIPGLAEARMATFVAMYTEHHAAHAASLSQYLDNYGQSARLYAMQGAFISAADYLHAMELGRRVRLSVDKSFEVVDIIAMPTSPFVTAEAARKPSEHRAGMNTVFTVAFNMTGHPAMTVPAGVSALGIPIGVQFASRHFEEQLLLRVSHFVEHATPWKDLHPTL